jgi:hypothetical protein
MRIVTWNVVRFLSSLPMRLNARLTLSSGNWVDRMGSSRCCSTIRESGRSPTFPPCPARVLAGVKRREVDLTLFFSYDSLPPSQMESEEDV